MSLRIIYQAEHISQWIAERQGTPVCRRGTDGDVRILFGESHADYEPISLDELLETLKLQHLVLLVDQEPGKTFHKIYQHS